MRISPSVTGTVPREVLPGGIIDDGQLIPAGTVVDTGFYSIHHNPAYFADLFNFCPERWIAGSESGATTESVELATNGFFSFSYGPRGCLGKNLAYTEMRCVIARTLWGFDLRFLPGSTIGDVDKEAEKGAEGRI